MFTFSSIKNSIPVFDLKKKKSDKQLEKLSVYTQNI